jgi:hypothetical protein
MTEQEYQTRNYIFMCKATTEYPPDEYYSICKFEGTKQQLDSKVNLILSIDKNFEYIIEKTYNNFREWAAVYRTDKDVKLRRSMNKNKIGQQRKAEYKYLKNRF